MAVESDDSMMRMDDGMLVICVLVELFDDYCLLLEQRSTLETWHEMTRMICRI